MTLQIIVQSTIFNGVNYSMFHCNHGSEVITGGFQPVIATSVAIAGLKLIFN